MQHLSALLCFFWSSLYDIYGMVCLVAFPWNTCGMATNQNASQPKTRYCPASEQNTLDQFQIYSTINYDPALKFTTRITFLTSIPPAECYGRDPEVYSVYLHVEPCRAMSSLGLQRRLKSRYWRCHPWSPARWSPDPVDPASKVIDILTQQERFRERIVGQRRPFHEIKIIRIIRGAMSFVSGVAWAITQVKEACWELALFCRWFN